MSSQAIQTNRQTFRKMERLVSRKTFEKLMDGGRYIVVPPFRLVWLIEKLTSPFPVQVAFSVPKRNFRLAVHRNRIKRLMREVYRKNKTELYSLLKTRNEQYAILLVFTGNTVPPFEEVQQKLTLTLQRFANEIEKHPV